jgi:hypothetical protein
VYASADCQRADALADAPPHSPFALAISILAGFVNRCQQDAIDYLREENRYDKLQGALKNLGHIVCPKTTKAILLRNGISLRRTEAAERRGEPS